VTDRHALRETFGQVPELYDRARPVYPDAVFADIARLGGLREGARVLEIGCGTGQATLPLAQRRYELTCLELSPALAALARAKLAAFPRVEIVETTFEAWRPPSAEFDAVVAFTAFHWLDPEVRFAKAAEVLRRGGTLAVVDTQHVALPGGDTFWAEVQADYDAVVPSEDNRPPGPPEEIPDFATEIEASGLFDPFAAHRYVWDVTYTADEYIDVLETYSGHRSMEDAKRHRLYDLIRHRIAERPNRTVTKTYLTTLNLASRRPR
jgi:SAM-dependent methyltransferase